MVAEISVCVVGESSTGLDALAQRFAENNLAVVRYRSAEDCLAANAVAKVMCVITAHGLRGMSGLELQERVRPTAPHLPFIIVSQCATVTDAIRAYDAGASAFVQEPIDIQAIADTAQHLAVAEYKRRTHELERQNRLGELSPREHEILDLLLQGDSVKKIGRDLSISPSTAEKHRASILEKTGFDSIVGLAHFVYQGHAAHPAVAPPSTSVRRRQTTPSVLR